MKHPTTCRYCGILFDGPPTSLGPRKYCSSRCNAFANPKPSKGASVVCAECGATIYKHPCHIRKNKSGKFFCSSDCMHNHNRVTRISLTCDECGVMFERLPCDVRQREHLQNNFCSRQCDYNYHTGPNHAHWKGGVRVYRGPDWEECRLEALERDNYTCQRCGVISQSLPVHHITPYRITQDNSLHNLISLCSSCHRVQDAEFQRNE